MRKTQRQTERQTERTNNVTSTNNRPANNTRRGRTPRAIATGLVALAALGLAPTAAGAIVNGTPSSTAQNPWQVSIQDDQGHACGGSIISSTQIVTAAHCFADGNGLTVLAGSDNLTTSDGQRVEVTGLVNHPAYATSEKADVAVITLATPLEFNGKVQPIGLATSSEISTAESATVTGWGELSENGSGGSDQLQSVDVPLVDDASCSANIDGGINDAAELCAGGNGNDSCYGDSGGPLVISTETGPKLAGIVSWGEECAGASPGVYTEVPTFSEFITSNGTTGDDFTAPAAEAGDDEDYGYEDDFEDDDEWDDTDYEDDGYWEDDSWEDDDLDYLEAA